MPERFKVVCIPCKALYKCSAFFTVSQKKLCHYTFVHNFDKRQPIFEIFSPSYLPRNLQQTPCHTSHNTLKILLHYVPKHKRPELAKFCCTKHNNFCLMFTKLTDMIGKITYALYGVNLNAQNFLLSHEYPHRDF